MVKDTLENQVIAYMSQMPQEARERVATYARELAVPPAESLHRYPPSEVPVGVPVTELLQVLETIPRLSDEDAKEMMEAIEEEREKIN